MQYFIVRPALPAVYGALAERSANPLKKPSTKPTTKAPATAPKTTATSCQRRIPNAYAMPTRAAKYAICTRTPSKAISCKATSITVPTATEIKPYKAFALASFALIAPPNKAPICWTKMAIEMAFLSHLILLAYYTQD
ncbi:hypothetical protein [Phyllobacterium phragmitis]|uniref:hypothetical protein n=1 Tax=Phyllobacterium phragmitis TaxID=2670329 RepID=UPI0038B25C8E